MALWRALISLLSRVRQRGNAGSYTEPYGYSEVSELRVALIDSQYSASPSLGPQSGWEADRTQETRINWLYVADVLGTRTPQVLAQFHGGLVDFPEERRSCSDRKSEPRPMSRGSIIQQNWKFIAMVVGRQGDSNNVGQLMSCSLWDSVTA